MWIFAHPLDTSGYDANGEPVTVPEYIIHGVSAPVSVAELDARRAFLRLDEVSKLAYILDEMMPAPPVLELFEDLATAAAVSSDRIAATASRLDVRIRERSSTAKAALTRPDIVRIIQDEEVNTEKKLRIVITKVKLLLAMHQIPGQAATNLRKDDQDDDGDNDGGACEELHCPCLWP